MADIPINPVTRRVEFTGNTGTGPFAFTFNVLAQADIAVYKNNGLLTLTSHYTVSLNSNGTGSITLASALIATDELVIIGDLPLSRTTDFVTAGDLLASSLNEQFDSNVVMSQQLDERFDRTIRSQPGDINKNLYLPLVDDRVSQLLSFDSSGNITTTNLSNVPDIGTVNLTVSGLASFADGSLGAPSITNIGDTNTGIYFPAADQLAFTAGGNNIFSITSTYGLMSKPLYFSDGILLTDNSATALTIKEGSNNYLTFVTTNGSEKLSFGKPIDVTGAITTNTSLNIASSTTVTGILDEDNMASNSATKLATQQSIKAYVDAQVGTVDTLAEVLGNGNTTGSNNIIVTAGQSITVDTISETTAANGVVIDGVTLKDGGATVTADVSFGDNDKAIFGAGSDLEIYHASSTNNSVIQETGSGNLLIYASNISMADAGGNEFILMTDTGTGGTVELKHTTSTKLATTSTGVDITGTLTSDGLTVDGQGLFQTGTGSSLLTLKNTDSSISGGESIQMDWVYGDTANSTSWRQLSRFAGNQYQWFSNIDDAGYNLRMSLYEGGDFALYEDTGTTAKFFWDASAESLGIGTTSPSAVLHVSSSDPKIYLQDSDSSGVAASPYMGFYDSSSRLGYLGYAGSTESDFYIHNEQSANIRFITGTTERMRIDSSGNVGVGVTNGGYSLSVGGSTGDKYIQIRSDSGSNLTGLLFADGQFSNTGAFFYDHSGDYLWTRVNGSEAMRIDSSGNLLVGTTDTAPGVSDTNVGVALNSGRVFASAEADYALNLNRNTLDGDIVRFRKDGTTVGSIGTKDGFLYIEKGDAGLTFDNTNNRIFPSNDGSASDDNLDLGHDDARFKNLYLSGGVYLGGVGDANKLDDYEEGTWTPATYGASTATISSVEGLYTKIGNMVYASFTFNVDTNSDSAHLRIQGLPFTVGSSQAARGGVLIGYQNSGTACVGNGVNSATRFSFFTLTGSDVLFSTFSNKLLRGVYVYSV